MADNGRVHGFGSINIYRDLLRETPVGTLTLSAAPSSPDVHLSYFGFVDFPGKGFWSEQNFRYRLGSSPMSASFQYVAAKDISSPLGRFGLLFNLHNVEGLQNILAKAGIYALGVDAHLLELNSGIFDGKGIDGVRRGGQLEPYIVGAIPGTSGKIFYEGWLDFDIDRLDQGSWETTAVSDFLVGANIVGDPTATGSLRLVTEGRYNGYLARLRDQVPALRQDASLNPLGLEIGASYFVAF